MPVEEDINLDNPDGLTQEDIDALKRQAEEIELYAENVEENVEKVERASKKLKDSIAGMNLYQQDLLREGPGQGAPTGTGATPQGSGMSQNDMHAMIADILQKMKVADGERKANREGLTKAQIERKLMEKKIAGTLSTGEYQFNQIQVIGANPFGFAKGKILGLVGKAGIYGFIALMVYRIAETLWKEYLKTFEPGGPNDIRKMMEDRDKEMQELDDIIKRNAGQVFLTEDLDLKQGAPQMEHTS